MWLTPDVMSDERIKTDDIRDLRPFLLQLIQNGKASEMIDLVLSIIQKLKDETLEQAKLIRWLQQKPFRRSSEVVDYLQASLFGNEPPKEEPKQIVKSESEKKTKSAHGGGRSKLPDHLPRREIIIEVPEDQRICQNCDAPKSLIGYETSEVLDYVPGHFEILVSKREKLACSRCEDGLVAAPAAHKLIDKGIPGVGLITEIMVSKYRDHLPLYRLEERFARLGVPLSRSSMSSWIQTITEDLLQPIVDRIHDKALASFLLQSDDTTLRVLDQSHPKNTLLGYLWFYIGDRRYAFADFTTSRGREGPINILKPREKGYLQTDGYSGYERLYNGQEASLIHVGCWMHARRYFHDAYELKDFRALPMLEWIRDLYAIEEKHKDKPPEDLLAARQTMSYPIIESIRQWSDENVGRVPPETRIGKAIRYMRNQWPSLLRFLEDGRIPLDNGEVERAIRPIAIGRKNYLFAGSRRGARNAAAIYSLMATCALNDIQPDRYLSDVLDKLMRNWPAKKIDDLIPDRWKELFGQNMLSRRDIHAE
jgi:transposase